MSDILDRPGISLAVFTAEWCQPCKQMKPIIEEVNMELSSLRIEMIDADTNAELANFMGVRSVPTLALVKDGQVAAMHAGKMQKAQLKSWIKDLVS